MLSMSFPLTKVNVRATGITTPLSHGDVMMEIKLDLSDLFWSAINKGSDIVDQFSL